MPITDVPVNPIFNPDYAILGEYKNDGSEVPWYNTLATMLQPGEPLLVKWAASGAEEVFWNKKVCHPGEWATLIKPGFWAGILPCTLTANVILGDELYWDLDESEVALVGDVTNGFIVGDAGIVIPHEEKVREAPAVDGNGRVIAGTTASTNILVMSRAGATTTKGTVTVY